jgi:protocatechuate 3,4-dioxygenase beta subunit
LERQTAAEPAPAPAEVLEARIGGSGLSPSSARLMKLVRRLHAAVEELRTSQDDLRRVLEFLTEVGHHSDARRQEWVLLADVLGISALVEDLTHPRPPGATPNTLAGPFYRPDVPEMPEGADLSRDGKGEPLAVTGLVADTAGEGIGGAVVEIWQANAEGRYENQEPDRQPDLNLRGKFRADRAGRFRFRSVKPKGYGLPEDGPVGRLMNGLGFRLERPAHLHFRVTAPGYQCLTTHVFDADDPAIERDALFSVKPDLRARFVAAGTEAERSWSLALRLVLARDGETAGTSN